MTFDLAIWPLISSTNEGFHVASMMQVWFQLDFKILKLRPNVNPFLIDDNRGKSDLYVSPYIHCYRLCQYFNEIINQIHFKTKISHKRPYQGST